MKKVIVTYVIALFIVVGFQSAFAYKSYTSSSNGNPLEVNLEWDIWYVGDIWSVVFIAKCSDENGIDRVEFHINNGSNHIVYFEPYKWYIEPIGWSRLENSSVCAIAYNLHGERASDCIKWSHPPSIPIIDGPASGKIGMEYTYIFNSTDLVGNYCNCIVDWGDGIIECVGANESGPGIANHTWDTKGIYVISANTRGTLDQIAEELGIKAIHIPRSKSEKDSKLTSLRVLDPEKTIAIGNGNNDLEIITQSKIGIAVLGEEGASIQALVSSDIVVQSVSDAFKILLDEQALIATLRK